MRLFQKIQYLETGKVSQSFPNSFRTSIKINLDEILKATDVNDLPTVPDLPGSISDRRWCKKVYCEQ